MQNTNHDNKFFSGFLLGLIVGSAVVFLLATKTGKKILKLVSEEGFERLSDIVDEKDFQEEEIEEVDTVVEEPEVNGEVKKVIARKPRRFFKRVKKTT